MLSIICKCRSSKTKTLTTDWEKQYKGEEVAGECVPRFEVCCLWLTVRHSALFIVYLYVEWHLCWKCPLLVWWIYLASINKDCYILIKWLHLLLYRTQLASHQRVVRLLLWCPRQKKSTLNIWLGWRLFCTFSWGDLTVGRHNSMDKIEFHWFEPKQLFYNTIFWKCTMNMKATTWIVKNPACKYFDWRQRIQK